MKLDDDLRLAILERVGIYSARLAISEPRVLLSTREVLALPKDLTRGRRSTAYKYYGVAYLKSNIIFINVRKIENEKALENTIAHELVHMRFSVSEPRPEIQQACTPGAAGQNFSPLSKAKLRFLHFLPFYGLYFRRIGRLM